MKLSHGIAATLITMVLSGCGGGDAGPGLNPESKHLTKMTKSVGTSPADYQNVVETLYVAYFGRPADPGGLANFESALLAAGAPSDVTSLAEAYSTNATVKALIDSFGTSAESQALYGSSSTSSTSFVTAVYTNLLNRQPEQAGLTFWSSAIASGNLSMGNAALSITAGAYGNSTTQGQADATLISNRIAVATTFTNEVDSGGETTAYAGSGMAWVARNMLSQVTATTNATAFQATIATTITNIVSIASGLSALNDFRTAEGPGEIPQNAALFQAAYGHANYMALNGIVGHAETSGLPGFIGVDPGHRAELYGYPVFDIGEEASGYTGANGSLAGQGADAVNNLIATVYHRLGLLYQYQTDVGLGMALSPDGNSVYTTIDLGYQNASETPISGNGYTNFIPYPTTVSGSYFGVYPLAGQAGVPLCMQPETPSPFPNLTAAEFATNTGFPISVIAPTNSTITVTSFSLTQTGSSTPLSVTLFTGSDPNFNTNNNAAFIVANQSLLPNTSYTAAFVGTSNGVAINRSWSFTTGPGT